MLHTYLDLIGSAFGRAISLEWLVVCLAISVVVGVLAGRLILAPIWALVAVAMETVVMAALPTVRAGGTLSADIIMAELQKILSGADLATLGIHYAIYVYVIGVVYLTKIDLFRPWPADGSSAH